MNTKVRNLTRKTLDEKIKGRTLSNLNINDKDVFKKSLRLETYNNIKKMEQLVLSKTGNQANKENKCSDISLEKDKCVKSSTPNIRSSNSSSKNPSLIHPSFVSKIPTPIPHKGSDEIFKKLSVYKNIKQNDSVREDSRKYCINNKMSSARVSPVIIKLEKTRNDSKKSSKIISSSKKFALITTENLKLSPHNSISKESVIKWKDCRKIMITKQSDRKNSKSKEIIKTVKSSLKTLNIIFNFPGKFFELTKNQLTTMLSLYDILISSINVTNLIDMLKKWNFKEGYCQFERIKPKSKEIITAIQIQEVLILIIFLICRDKFEDEILKKAKIALSFACSSLSHILNILSVELFHCLEATMGEEIKTFLSEQIFQVPFVSENESIKKIDLNNKQQCLILKNISKEISEKYKDKIFNLINCIDEDESRFKNELQMFNKKHLTILDNKLYNSLPTIVSEISFHEENTEPDYIVQPIQVESILPPKKDVPELTLVLDLDETLVHFDDQEDGGQFLVRPFATEFLQKMSIHYEIIIFTAAMKDYADWILDRIDSNKFISHRLYRDNTSFQGDAYLKDLSKIGRPLEKTLIIDNHPENFKLQPENGIYIKTWTSDASDCALKQLGKLLMKIAENPGSDIRHTLRNHSNLNKLR